MYVCMYDIVQQQVESVSKMEGQLICLLFFMVMRFFDRCLYVFFIICFFSLSCVIFILCVIVLFLSKLILPSFLICLRETSNHLFRTM